MCPDLQNRDTEIIHDAPAGGGGQVMRWHPSFMPAPLTTPHLHSQFFCLCTCSLPLASPSLLVSANFHLPTTRSICKLYLLICTKTKLLVWLLHILARCFSLWLRTMCAKNEAIYVQKLWWNIMKTSGYYFQNSVILTACLKYFFKTYWNRIAFIPGVYEKHFITTGPTLHNYLLFEAASMLYSKKKTHFHQNRIIFTGQCK